MSGNGNGIWKPVATGAGAALVSVLGAFYSLNLATEAYVKTYVQDNSPYLKDRQLIVSSLSRSEENSGAVTVAIQENTKAIVRLQVTLEQLQQRLGANE